MPKISYLLRKAECFSVVHAHITFFSVNYSEDRRANGLDRLISRKEGGKTAKVSGFHYT